MSHAHLLYTVPNDTLPAALIEAVESEDTPQSYAYAFMTAPLIPGMDLSVLFDHIEDIVAQADETSSTLYVSIDMVQRSFMCQMFDVV